MGSVAVANQKPEGGNEHKQKDGRRPRRVTLVLFLSWYMSPYEQCVRAFADGETERLIAEWDHQPDFRTYDLKTDNASRLEQTRLAKVSCTESSN